MRPRVRVPERGSVDVSAEEWAALSTEPAFWKLVERGVVKVAARSGGRGRLEGTGWIGRARFADLDLDVVEKVSGALRALLAASTPATTRLDWASAPIDDAGALLAQVAQAYVEEARRYASTGLEFVYRQEPEVAALVAGRLDIRRTIRLRAQGRRHLLGFDRSTISQDTEVNRIALAALRQVERLNSVIDLPRATVVTARAIAPIFAGARDPRTLLARRTDVAARARRLADQPDNSRTRDLLALASALLAERGFAPEGDGMELLPRSWFIDLETLFEAEARRALQGAAQEPISVVSDAGRPAIFERPSDIFRADPDFVVLRSGDSAVTGDVKYKDWPGATGAGSLHSDVYQLLVHARAHDTRVAMLVFPHDRFSLRILRRSATQADVVLVAMNVTDLQRSGRTALRAVLGLDEARRKRDSLRSQALLEARAEELADSEATAVQAHAVKTLTSMVQRVDAEHVAAVRRTLERTIKQTWDQLEPDVQTMLLSAVYFGLHADEEGLDLSGPVLGLFACCEALAKKPVLEGLPEPEAALVCKASFGQVQKALRQDVGRRDPRGPIFAAWLNAQPPQTRAYAVAAAEDMKRLVGLRNVAAHAELLSQDAWVTAFDEILAPTGTTRLLERLARLSVGEAT